MLDRGELRVAEPAGDDWTVNEWAKKAVLLYFRVRDLETTEVGPFEYHDRLPLKRGYEEAGVRVVPPATARHGAFLSPGVVLMPSYVNIGAWVGPGTLVDTWATVGSCAQIGADVHLSGGRRDRGRPRARPGETGDRRGRGVRRVPLHRGRGRAGAGASRARRGTDPHGQHPRDRRDRRRAGGAPRRGPRRGDRRSRLAPTRVPGRRATDCRPDSSSATAPRRPTPSSS